MMVAAFPVSTGMDWFPITKHQTDPQRSKRSQWPVCGKLLFFYVTFLGTMMANQFFRHRILVHTMIVDVEVGVGRRLTVHSAGGHKPRIRYFVLDDPRITRMDIREKVLSGTNATWIHPWGQRFRDEYAAWEIRFLQALEGHADRTFDVGIADYFVLPLPVGGIMTYGNQKDLRSAIQTIAKHPIFQAYNDRFVLISLIEFVFHPGHKEQQAFQATGWCRKYYGVLKNITVVKDIDLFAWHSFRTQFPSNDWGPPESDEISFTRRGWSLGFSGAASDPTMDLVIPTYESFVKRKYEIFYHTTMESSLFNSTIYRHAPILHGDGLPRPSSIGFDIPEEDWKKHFGDSKYCLVVRGDNPTSRALWRTIRQGCIPIIVSNALPFYGPSMKTQMDMRRYSIFIREQEFAADPAGTLRRAINLPEANLRAKINELALFQRMIIVDHPDSLFVPSFGLETLASWRDHEKPNVSIKPAISR